MDSNYDPPTPPMRLPKRAPKKAKTPAPKKDTFSASAFAKMVLVNQQGIDELKPLPRSHMQTAMDSDEEDDILVYGDDDDEIYLPDNHEVVPPRSPNYNPDLSDDEMSRSPSPFNPINVDLCLPSATRYTSHPVNVPSAAPESYFHKNIPRISEPYVNKPIGNGETVKTNLPIAYWKWPTGADEHKAEQGRKARTREKYVPTVFNPVVRTLKDSDIRITVQPTARPPHINWILRKKEAEEEAKAKAAEAVALAARLKKEKMEHREKMEKNKDAANAAVLAGVKLDEDGFYHVKGTRKRNGPGIDLEEGRKRRSYIWKSGPPLRGKALKEAKAKAEAEAMALMAKRQERLAKGEDLTDSEDEESSEEESGEETPVVTKVVKKVAKASKTAVAARNSAAPKKPRAPRKPAALKKTVTSKKNAASTAKGTLDGLVDSESDAIPILTSKKTPAAKKVAGGNLAADADDIDTPVARKIIAPKKKAAKPRASGAGTSGCRGRDLKDVA